MSAKDLEPGRIYPTTDYRGVTIYLNDNVKHAKEQLARVEHNIVEQERLLEETTEKLEQLRESRREWEETVEGLVKLQEVAL